MKLGGEKPPFLGVNQLGLVFNTVQNYENLVYKRELARSKEMDPLYALGEGESDYDKLRVVYDKIDEVYAQHDVGWVQVHCSGAIQSDHPCLDGLNVPACTHYWFEEQYCWEYGCSECDSGCQMDEEITNRYMNDRAHESYFYDNFFEQGEAHKCPFYSPEVDDAGDPDQAA
jgi:hypothetical protein